MEVILGSQSQGRKEILEKAGLQFSIHAADLDEKAIRTDNHKLLPLVLAKAKAKVLLEQIHTEALLITADQVVICNGELREKPISLEQATTYLHSYSHYPAETYTGVVVTNTKTKEYKQAVTYAKIYFSPLPEEVIAQIVAKKAILQAAGAFIFQDPLLQPYIISFVGEIESIIGLPLSITKEFIAVLV